MDLRPVLLTSLVLAATLGLACSKEDRPAPGGAVTATETPDAGASNPGEPGNPGQPGDPGKPGEPAGPGHTGVPTDAGSASSENETAGAATETEVVTPPILCGTAAGWDEDGDGISDTIERNNSESGYVPFQLPGCDTDPSRPGGSYYAGRLDGSVNLKDRGTGYVHNRGGDPVDADDWGSLALLACLETVGREWEATGRELNVNDLSQRGGGRFRPHRSHQNGLDVDLRYVRRDGKSHPLDIRRDPEAYDADATQALMKLILDHCNVNVIFADVDRLGFDSRQLGSERQVLAYAPGHSNHFHLRLNAPSAAGGSP